MPYRVALDRRRNAVRQETRALVDQYEYIVHHELKR